MDTATSRLLTTDEAAEILRLTTRQVARLANAGKVPTVRLPGNEIRIDEADLWAWVQEHKQPGGNGDE